jgi:imidazolonepropionase-like amidohydrolase
MRMLFALTLLIAPAAQAETVAIIGAKVWTGASATPIDDATIVIADGRIVSIGRSTPPAGARIVAGQGRVVTLPLQAAATQIGLVEVLAAKDTDDRAVATGPIGAAFDVSRAIDPNALPVQEARAQGVSHAMVFPGAPGNGVFAGQGALIRLNGGPDLVTRAGAAMFVVTGGSAKEAAGGSRGATWTRLRLALDEAKAYRARPASLAPRDQLLGRADIDALLPVLDRRMPLAIFAQREADIRQAAALFRDYGLRGVVLGGAEAWRAADLLAANKVPVILDPLDALPTSYDTIGSRRENAAILAHAGVTIAFSVSAQGIYLSYDVGPAMREGAGIAVANGLPYVEALAAITTAPGRIWTDTAGAGPIAPGRPADLILWDGDPLEPSSAPALVMIDGKEVSRTTRQTLLRDRYAPGATP